MISATLRLLLIAVCFSLVVTDVSAAPEVSGPAELIAASSGFSGGVCVVLGSSDAKMAMVLARQGRYTVEALYADETALAEARAAMRSGGDYGTISAHLASSNRLPYTENLINLIVINNHPGDAAEGVSLDELLRVLAPLGAVYFGDANTSAGLEAAWVKPIVAKLSAAGFAETEVLTGAGTWVKAVKPWPQQIDQWTHYLHAADGNPVAQDRVVGPPAHYQWVCGPRWLRSHESDSSVRALVTARGRLFYIADEAPISLLGDHPLPDKWFLMARDAFNGTLLWKVPIEDWGWRAWKPSWFTPRPGDIPLNIPKRLVAVDDKVYVTLGYRAPVSQLDANTGKLLQSYQRTARTAEILHHDGRLVLTVLEDDGARVVVVDASGGERLWTSANAYGGTKVDYYRFTAMYGSVTPAKVDPTLNTATDGEVIALLDGTDVVCLDFQTGQEKWRTTFPAVEADRNAGRIDARDNVWTGTLIVHDGVVVHASPNQMAAFSAGSGEILWTQPKKYLQHLWFEWKDVFVIDGLVWTWSAELARGKLAGSNQQSAWPVSANGYDLHTGRLEQEVPLGNIFKTHHHHRCYRNKATSRYILASRRGTEYVDLEQGRHSVNNWVRGTCHLGMMPANGLQYAPPHPCVCYNDEKLNGFNALAPARESTPPADDDDRLHRGPAYGSLAAEASSLASDSSEDWPTFRRDPLRSGSVETQVPAAPELLWHRHAGRKVGPPTIVDGRIFVPLVDQHQVVALDAADGKRLWESSAGGRIDSPPTYYRGTVIFGSADGCVYCVRADDGRLVWRFHAAPERRRIGAFGQLESAWPVHGSVLVLDGTAYFAAGRSSQLDGGLYLYGLDAATGQIRCRTRLQGPHYGVDDIAQNYQLPMGVLPDVMQGDESLIYMRNAVFNTKLQRQQRPIRETGGRVIAKGGLLDDSYFKRIPWSFRPKGSYARLVVHNDRAAYAVRMFDSLRGLDPKVYFVPGKAGYLLFATDQQSGKQIWGERIRVRINAMVATEGALFIAGPPDVVDPQDPLGAFEGRKGGVLAAIDPASGKRLWQHELPSPPVFHGMAAAAGRLYVAMQDGSVACFGKPGAKDATAAESESKSQTVRVYLGTYTGRGSQGIYLTHLDLATGKLQPVELAAEVANPSFLAIHPGRPLVYAVGEMGNFQGKKTGAVSALSMDPATGKLTLLNQQSSQGVGPCHVTVDRSGRHVLVANYGSGSVACLPIRPDGRLGEATSAIQHEGSSVDPRRQLGPHAHSINVDAANRFAFAADLGLDKILIYRLDAAAGTLRAHDPPWVKLPPGAGPRHFAFHPTGRYAYVINEINSTVTAFRYDAGQGTLAPLQTVSTLPEGFDGQNTTAEVQVHPSGSFVYGSNRGHDSIACFAVDAATGKLTPIGRESTQGKTPRNFGIDPTGNYLLAAHQTTDNVVVFRIDGQTGKLRPTGQSLKVAMPVCVKMIPCDR